jgi:deaminated glutathione amidase
MTRHNPAKLIVATIQMVSNHVFSENLDTAVRLIEKAAEAGASLVVLPEYFSIMALREIDKFEYVEEHGNGVMQDTLKRIANKLSLWIVAGSHPIQSDNPQRPYGRCYVFDPQGEVVSWYDKIHLFDVQVSDNQKSYCESKYTKAGTQVTSFQTPWAKVGLAICYDLRFPELFRKLQQTGCELIIVPAAFTAKTGAAHWDLLTRTRALENLCYLVSSAQGGHHTNGRETWGHSNIVSPWGELLAEIEFGEGILISELDFGLQKQIRKEFPVLDHKRI